MILFKKNVLYTSVGAYAVQALGILNAMVISRFLSSSDYGVYALILSIIVAIDKGLEFGITQWVVKLKSRSVLGSVLKAEASTRKNYFLIFSVCTIAFFILRIHHEYALPVYLLSFLFLFKGLKLQYVLALKYKEEHAFIAVVNIVSNFFFYLTAILGLFIWKSFYALIFGQLLKHAIEVVVYYRRGTSLVSNEPASIEVLNNSRSYRYGVFKTDIIGVMRGILIPVLITKILGSDGYGIIAFAKKVGEMMMVATRSIGQLILQKMARDSNRNDSLYSMRIILVNIAISIISLLALSIGIRTGFMDASWSSITQVTFLFLCVFLTETVNFVHIQRLKIGLEIKRYVSLVFVQFFSEITVLYFLIDTLDILVVPFSMFISVFLFTIYFLWTNVYQIFEKIVLLITFSSFISLYMLL